MYYEIARVLLRIKPIGRIVLNENDSVYRSFRSDDKNSHDTIHIEIQSELPFETGVKEGFQKKVRGFSWTMYENPFEKLKIVMQPKEDAPPFWVADTDRSFQQVLLNLNEIYRRPSDTSSLNLSNPVQYPLDQILMIHYLASRKGLILHAAGAMINDRGVIFPGYSGAGKSSISELLRAYSDIQMMSDDRIIVRQVDSDFYQYGTPWYGSSRISENICAPLSVVMFLVKDTRTYLVRLDPADALKQFFPVSSILWYDQAWLSDCLAMLEQMVNRIPVYALHFRLDREDVFKLLEEALN
jgi:hypothetical protein